jgi:hypothetical protein
LDPKKAQQGNPPTLALLAKTAPIHRSISLLFSQQRGEQRKQLQNRTSSVRTQTFIHVLRPALNSSQHQTSTRTLPGENVKFLHKAEKNS